MEITEVRVFPRKDGDRKLKAFVTITFDDCFVVRDLKVIEGSKGLFVAMPSRKVEKKGDGEPGDHGRIDHRDIAHPITPACREYIQKAVLDAYHGRTDTVPGSEMRDLGDPSGPSESSQASVKARAL